MKTLIYLLGILFCSVYSVFSQNVSGKWYGKITQQPGGYSELYDFELHLNQKKNIWGDSYAYFKDSVNIQIGLSGYIDRDTIRLSESKDWVRVDKVPWNWVACIKNISVSYRKENQHEYLEGRWDGTNKDNPLEACIPGRVILSRTKEGLNQFLFEHRDSVIFADKTREGDPPPPIDFTQPFLNTEARKVTEIGVQNTKLQIQVLDYMKVDNDTVSVYLNRKELAKNIQISKRATIINFNIDPRIELHELLLYAENLGEIPPNTSELLLIDGTKTYRIMIASDLQKTAAVYLRYSPPKND